MVMASAEANPNRRNDTQRRAVVVEFAQSDIVESRSRKCPSLLRERQRTGVADNEAHLPETKRREPQRQFNSVGC